MPKKKHGLPNLLFGKKQLAFPSQLFDPSVAFPNHIATGTSEAAP